MFKNYLKTAFRNLIKNKVHSFINISGLAVGMAVAIVIGLWIWDELSFNKGIENYNKLAQVMQHQTFNGETGTQTSLPYPMSDALKNEYGGDFKYISMSSFTHDHILAFGENKITKGGNYFEPQITEMLSLKMIKGTRSALHDNHSIILSSSTAKALFGDADPMDKVVKIDNDFIVKVTGVYADLPYNSDFNNLTFIAPWSLYFDSNNWPFKLTNPWRANAFRCFVQLADNADVNKVSSQIEDVKLRHVAKEEATFKPAVFLEPLSRWHLYSEYKNGINIGGRIEFVWLFGIIGFFVLLLACINFMNLSTARSEKRAKEVGIRKAIGSMRSQLIKQFFAESLMITIFAFALSLFLVQLAIPFFNNVADKKISILFTNPLFWLMCIAFTSITGLIAGSYPALYLSSFQPVKVLKGTFRAGRFANVPRKVLVVLQFSVSVILIIGTIVVFNQIQFAKNRPVGFSRNNLIRVNVVTDEIHNHLNAIQNELKSERVVLEMAESSTDGTYVDENDNGFTWPGKDPSVQGNFNVVFSSRNFGKTIGWQIKEGRDFSKDFATDSSGIILNETAAKFMHLKNAIGETITWDGRPYHVIGVIKDMVMESPYEPVMRSVFLMDAGSQRVINIKINPEKSAHEALSKIEVVFKKYNPAQPFDYKFIDEQYALKFGDEERIGKLASFFAALAIFISCLGLFGMAMFMAEQRTKEIGVRKVLGASVFNVWSLLSKDFVVLVIISLIIASPVAYYFMNNWLQRYEYRTEISWWIFVTAAIGALSITLLTVSYQSIKAALTNPVKSLKTE
jgi:putative ABC transport system permease protein